MMVISERRPELRINFGLIKEHQDMITPELFLINEKLQISGNFFISIYECSELETMVDKP